MAREYDAVIVGSGAGGSASAWALTRRGLKVLLLEAGPAYDPASDYRLDELDWETRRFPHKVPVRKRQTYAPMQALDPQWDDLRSWNKQLGPYAADKTRQVDGYQHVVGLGGSTLHYTGEAHRMHPEAMQMRRRFGVAADWPMDYAELEPFYVEAERLIGVAGPDDQAPRWRSAPFPLPAHELSYGSQKLGEGFRKLGLGWQANSRAALSRAYDGRPPCNYCGNCVRGCPRLDKASADVAVLPKAEATGRCSVMTGATVLRLEAGRQDRVARVVYVDAAGREAAIDTRIIVLACGAVETPRLLLNSAGPYARGGLGNESGQVGRNFMETVWTASTALHPEPLASYRGLPADAICWDHNAPNGIRDILGGCRFTPGVAETDLLGPLAYAKRIAPGWGKAHKQAMRASFGHALTVTAIGESLPNPDSYVDLDPTERDAHGLAKARLHSRLDELALQRMRFMRQTAHAVLDAAGAGPVIEEFGGYDYFAATHVFGTCRMGSDPRSSVVDGYGRSHRWRNLFVADASVFPSSGGGEAPSLTIMALAIRTGEKIAGLAARGEL